MTLAVTADQPVLLWGEPGIGKPAGLEQLAVGLGLPRETVVAGVHEPSDFAGLPIVGDDPAPTGVPVAPPDWAVRLERAGHGLLFLDELSSAPRPCRRRCCGASSNAGSAASGPGRPRRTATPALGGDGADPHLTKAEKMTPQTPPVDHELVRAAAHVARTRCRGDNHTMAAAARARDGRIVTAVNAYHFTGGPCAELVLIGAAAAQGAYELDTIVAVGDRDRGVVPPCGRCRQVLLDYFPGLGVVVGEGDRLRTVPVADLLPESYVWADHQLDAGETPPSGTS
ncbi:hypothetical protein GCM10019016_038440 [Streptomyces prasinosporus]|uniref:CMP/dCMP-type deaminase domain-containing protein n=2 Tax=Streptomyces prasinosporus TaxID=68256 RepID=A0ABP6TN94_9ACTN